MSHHISYFRRAVLIVLLMLVISAAGAQRGRTPTLPPPPPPTPSLEEQAQSRGYVYVIVGVNAPYSAETRLSPQAVEAQRAVINAARANVLAELAPYGAELRANSGEWTIPYLALTVDADGLAALQRSRNVAGIWPDGIRHISLASSLPVQDVPEAHSAGRKGAGTVVAVLDTGVDKKHPFLDGQVVGEACFSTNSPWSQSLCPSGSGTQLGKGAAKPGKCKTIEGCEHGTHVAGIVAGKPGVNPNHNGIAPEAGIYAVQVFTKFTDFFDCYPDAAPCLGALDSNIIGGLQQVYKDRSLYNIVSVNMSLGGGSYSDYCDGEVPSMTKAIEELYEAGVATVVASGNAGQVSYISFPACISAAVSVGAVDDSRNVAFYTNANYTLDLWGVGSDITSSVLNDVFESKDGTSMAAPQVAGAWAVVKSVRPGAGVDQVLAWFRATGYDIADINVTTDLIELGDAVNAALGVAAPSNLLPDAGFEGAATRASSWEKSGSGAKVVCGDATKVRTGQCAAQVKAGVGKLVQEVHASMPEDKIITLTGYIKASNAVGGKIIVKSKLSNGKTAKGKISVEGTYDYTYRLISAAVNKPAASIKVLLKTTASGKYFVDDLILTVTDQ